MLTAVRFPACLFNAEAPLSPTGRRYLIFASTPLLAIWVLCSLPLVAAPSDQAFTETALTMEWSESPVQLAANLDALNEVYARAKGSQGSRLATYSIQLPSQSLFELRDRERRYTTPQQRQDYSHELELQLKSNAVIDYETLPAGKRITVVINAVAKTETEIRRLFHSSEVEGMLKAQDLLGAPASLAIKIAITDVDERPVVASAYRHTNNHGRGFLLRLNDKDRPISINGNEIFLDPERQPLYFKPNSEDIEIREFVGYSPNFGSRTSRIGDIDRDTNSTPGNSPAADGRIVRASIQGSRITITPVKGPQGVIRKAEIWIRGWDRRGPTTVLPAIDPATAETLAKITVLVQTGTNRLPHWVGHATGFAINVKEGYVGPLIPVSGSWDATDPDGDAVTYALLGATKTGACIRSQTPGFSFGGACFALDSTHTVAVTVSGNLDYESVQNDPIGRTTLLATDGRGAVAEATLAFRVVDVDEPLSGGFKTSALSIHLPTATTKRLDLSELFSDPEERESLTFRANSNSPSIVSVNALPKPVLVLTAHKIGQTRVNVWASTKTSTMHSSVSIIVRNNNKAPSFPSNTRSYRFQIAENALVGTKIGNPISATDPDLGDVLTFRLQGASPFGLTSDGLQSNQTQLVVKGLLDYESKSMYSLPLTVSDSVASANVELSISLYDINESVRATEEAITPIRLAANDSRVLNATEHFVDDEGQTPTFSVSAYDGSIVDIFARTNGEIRILAKRIGKTDALLTARDTTGGVAAKQFTVIVEASEPPVVHRPIPDQTIQMGLIEMSLGELFKDPDSELTIEAVTSSAEDVLWALLPKEDGATLILYAWAVGSATVTIRARDPTGNKVSHSFKVTVTNEEQGETESLIADQTLTVGQRLGSLNLSKAFSTASEEPPSSFSINSSRPAIVSAVLASADVVAWWHALDCAEKRSALASALGASASNPYCKDYASLSVGFKAEARRVAAHYVLLHGIAIGDAEITVTGTYESGTAKTSTFAVTVQNVAASKPVQVPQRVAYVGETIEISVKELFGISPFAQTLSVMAQQSQIVTIRFIEDRQLVEIIGLSIGSTDIALIGIDSVHQRRVVRASLRIANRMQQPTAADISLHLEVGEEPYVLDLHTIFTEGQNLDFVLNPNDKQFIDASLHGPELIVQPLRQGSTEFGVRATNAFGESAAVRFHVSVTTNRLDKAATLALEGFGRAVLNSIESAIESRFDVPLNPPDVHSRRMKPIMSYVDLAAYTFRSDGTDWTQKDKSLRQSSYLPRNDLSSSFSSSPLIAKTFARPDALKYWTLWVHSDSQAFESTGNLGHVHSFHVGSEVVVNSRIQAGLAGSRLRGLGDYAFNHVQRWFEVEQILVSPYVRFQLNSGMSIWGIATAGTGVLATANTRDATKEPSHNLRTSGGLVGASHRLTSVKHFDLSWHGDVASLKLNGKPLSRTVNALTADIRRVRSGLTASFNLPISAVVSFKPFSSINLRYDSTENQENDGIELVGGAKFAFGSFNVGFRGRHFEVHDEKDLKEQGYAISITYKPIQKLSGLFVSFSPSWGYAEQSFDPFSSTLGIRTRTYLRPWLETNIDPYRFSMQGSLRYGILVDQDRFLLTPYVEARTQVGRDHRIGLRLHGTAHSARAMAVDFALQHTNFGLGEPDAGVALTATLRL